jgi:hypothetical protein
MPSLQRLAAIGGGALAVAGVLGCRGRSEAWPEPAGGVVPARSPGVLAYRLVYTFPARVTFFGVGGAFVVCEGECRAPKGVAPAPRTWVVTGDRIVADPTLWPRVDPGTDAVSYFGQYPERLYADQERFADRTSFRHVARRAGAGWERETARVAPSWSSSSPAAGDLEALVRAPFDTDAERRVDSGVGPLLLIGEGRLARWTGTAWTLTSAPWRSDAWPARLAGGATLVVAEQGVFRVDGDGSVTPVPIDAPDVKPDGSAEKRRFAIDGPGLWIHATRAGRTRLFAPADPAMVAASSGPGVVVLPGPPELGAPEPAVLAEVPPPAPFTPACGTPFVMFAGPGKGERTGELDPKELPAPLAGHGELQGALRFVEISRGPGQQRHDFGAQAATVGDARRLMAIVGEQLPASKPELTCLDVASRVQDWTRPPRGVAVHWLNLTTGVYVDRTGQWLR